MTSKKHVKLVVDGLNLNARYFAGMTKEEGIRALAAEAKGAGLNVDKDWPGKVWAEASAKVTEADKPITFKGESKQPELELPDKK